MTAQPTLPGLGRPDALGVALGLVGGVAMNRAAAEQRANETLERAKREASETMQVRYVWVREGECVVTDERPDGKHFRVWPGGRIEHYPHGRPGRGVTA